MLKNNTMQTMAVLPIEFSSESCSSRLVSVFCINDFGKSIASIFLTVAESGVTRLSKSVMYVPKRTSSATYSSLSSRSLYLSDVV